MDKVAVLPNDQRAELFRLHHEAFRPDGSQQPERYSRHYYDLARLAASPVKERAFGNLDLLKSVAASKDRFYPCGWARYDLATPPTLRLMPPAHIRKALERDYGERPAFNELMDQIRALESAINTIPPS